MLTHLGNYELLRPLGAGGMAQTFVARRRGPAGFEQQVCLKRVLPEHAHDAGLIEQFLDEARLLAHLRHANIVQVYDFGEADGTYFMALELVDGVDLQRLLKALKLKKLTLATSAALYIATEVLKALNYAHNARLGDEPMGLVHRDVSPANILLSRHAEVKLADFGIARSRQRRHRTQTGRTKGKVAYMSPEQVRGEALDARSDLFSVGIVLHELLTGVHPFDAPTDITLLNNIMTGNRHPLSQLSAALGDAVIDLVDALLAVDVTKRPTSAADALARIPALDQPFKITNELAELVNDCALTSPSTTPPPVRRRFDVEGPTEALPAARRSASYGGDPARVRPPDLTPPNSTEVLNTDELRSARSRPRGRGSAVLIVSLMASFLLVTATAFLLRTVPTNESQAPSAAQQERSKKVDGPSNVSSPVSVDAPTHQSIGAARADQRPAPAPTTALPTAAAPLKLAPAESGSHSADGGAPDAARTEKEKSNGGAERTQELRKPRRRTTAAETDGRKATSETSRDVEQIDGPSPRKVPSRAEVDFQTDEF